MALGWVVRCPLTRSFLALVSVQALGCQTTHSNQKVLQSCPLVIFATKPQVLPEVLSEVAPVVTTEHIVVSVAAGISLSSLEEVSGVWCEYGLDYEISSAGHTWEADSIPDSLQK